MSASCFPCEEPRASWRARTRPSSPIFSRAATALVKVGDGFYSDFEHPKLLGMRRMQLLEALSESKGFAVKLKGVALDDCKVFVHTKRIAGKVPIAEEESSSTEQVGADTIGSLAGDATVLFIRVELPATAGTAGTCPCSPLTRSPPPPSCADG